MKIILIFFTLFTLFTLSSMGQALEKHQWENRVLLVFADAKKSDKLQKQLEILSEEKEGLKERKLQVYSFTPTFIRNNFDEDWKKSNQLFKKYVDKVSDFQVFLIGLDGSVKLKQSDILTNEKLFTIIDGMPMRKRELRNNN